jgi:hypothetical protein
LIGYEWTPQEFVLLSPNANGRFLLDRIGVWLGIEDGKVACFDGATGKRLGDYTEVDEELQKTAAHAEAAVKRAEAAVKRAEAADKRAEAADKRVADERRQRLEVEAELNALKEKLRTLPDNG